MGKEIWKSVPGYEGLYDVSDLGSVRSSYGRVKRNLHLQPNKNGYLMVGLHKNGTRKMCYVHRLVAESFIGPCPEGFEVDHINRDRRDNKVKNLRFLRIESNHAQCAEKKKKPVHQYDLSGVYIASYGSRKEAEEKTGVSRRGICQSANGKKPSAGGFLWKNA